MHYFVSFKKYDDGQKVGGFQALEPSFSKSGGLEPSGLIEVYAYARLLTLTYSNDRCYI